MDRKRKRFLIDRIDERLGSLENELKFDRIMITVGTVCFIALTLSAFLVAESHPILALILALTAFFFLLLSYLMLKEYRSDLKRKHD